MLSGLCAFASVALAAGDGGRMIDQQVSAMEQKAIDDAWAGFQAQMADAGTPAHPPFKWRFPKMLSEFKVDGTVDVDGIPVRMHGVKVKGGLVDTLRDLRDEFIRQGLWMQDFGKQPQLASQTQITAFDPDRFISYTAIVEPLPDGNCRVIIGEANLAVGAQVRKQRAGTADFVALPPEVEGVMRAKSEGLDTISFGTNKSETDILRFFSDQLSARGYKSVGKGEWSNGSEEIRVRVSPVKGKNGVIVGRALATRPK